MLQLQEISKNYGKDTALQQVLKCVSLDIPQGEMLAIMGPSGSGKTTLLNIIGGLLTPDAGKIIYDGNDVDYRNKRIYNQYRKENISFIFQQYELMEHYCVLENVCLPLEIKGVPIKQRKMRGMEILSELGMEKLAKKRPSLLSGGEKQRCAIARAIAADTPIILADEPTGALDTENGEAVMELFSKVHKKGKTIIIVTHDEKVAHKAQRCIHLLDGRIV